MGGFMKGLVIFFILFSVIFLTKPTYSQDNSKNLPQIAVIEFEGQGITESESVPLTDRFRGELVRTNSFFVLDRDQMTTILEEQAFQMSGCTSTECAVEIGKILNIQKIVVGKIGKVGRTYTIDISYIDVETSRIEKSFNRNYVGAVEGILPILKEIAFEMIPAKEGISDIPLYISGIAALGSIGFGTYSFLKAQSSYTSYQDARTGEDAIKFKDDTENFDNLTLISGLTAGASVAFYFIYKHYYDRSFKPVGFYATPYIPDKYTYGLAVNLSF